MLGKTPGSIFHTPGLSLQSNDGDVVRRFGRVLGCGSVREANPGSGASVETVWIWRVHGADAIRVTKWFLPFLGERRSLRATELIDTYYRERSRSCLGCDKPMLARDPRRKYCDGACGQRYQRRLVAERGIRVDYYEHVGPNPCALELLRAPLAA